MAKLELRPHQSSTIQKLREGFLKGHRAQMLYLPCGGGKTEIAVSMLDASQQKGKRNAMIVDLTLLCAQTSARLQKYDIDHGVIQPKSPRYRPEMPIQVCMTQTLEARGGFPSVDFLVVDEAHTMRASVIEFIRNNPKVRVVGLSGSPFTKGLGSVYSNVVSAITINELVDQGFLIQPRVFIARQIDMTGAKKVAGEWSDKEATERGIKITGDIVTEWVAKTHEIFGGPKKTIVFCAGVAHGADLVEKFSQAGFNFISVSYKDDEDYKRQVLDDFSKPDTDIHGLIATDLLTKGFDVTDVCIGVSARPFSKSFSAHVQQLGRIMRPHEDKEQAIWMDHCIAGDQLVLTDRGPVRIDSIAISDLIWDGVEFVSHKGVVSRGIRPVITYAGLTATTDHLVKTRDEGWCSIGYCSDKQKAIVTTGSGRTALRECDGHLTGGGVARTASSSLNACALRVRNLWLSINHFFTKFRDWENTGLQTVQPTKASTGMAQRQNGSNDPAMQKPESRGVSQLWWQGHRVQIRFSDFLRSLDQRELGSIGITQGNGVGSNRQQRELRAREYSVAEQTSQSEQSAKNEMGSADASVFSGTPGDKVCSNNTSISARIRSFFRRHCRTLLQTEPEAEREVWDIIDCGPRNSFTCQGLLVHNSGNYLRFRDQWDELCSEGVSELKDGAEKTKPEPTDQEKEASKCPKCSHLWPSGTDTCPQCGFIRARRNDVVNVAGEMKEITPGQKPEKYSAEFKEDWYAQLLGYCEEKGIKPGYAYYKYHEKFKVYPSMAKPAAQEPGIAARNWITSQNIAWKKGKAA